MNSSNSDGSNSSNSSNTTQQQQRQAGRQAGRMAGRQEQPQASVRGASSQGPCARIFHEWTYERPALPAGPVGPAVPVGPAGPACLLGPVGLDYSLVLFCFGYFFCFVLSTHVARPRDLIPPSHP